MKRNQIERIKAYEKMVELKQKGISNRQVINNIITEYFIPTGTVYYWLKYNKSPFGKKKIQYNGELFYVLGALLGDGCTYYWKKGNKYIVVIVGEKELIKKYSEKLANCTGKIIRGYPYRDRNAWYLKTWNVELFMLLKKIKKDKEFLISLIKKRNYYNNILKFIEGYFDAEGCVKIIKEPIRKTPKICLDICSTDYLTLEIIRKALDEQLFIEARYSIQKAHIGKDGAKRQKTYHLRIYKKEFIRKFFENINTIKLKPEKIAYVNNWLNNRK